MSQRDIEYLQHITNEMAINLGNVLDDRDALAADLAACQARCERLQTELDQQVSENAALLRWLTPSQLRQALERKRKHDANGDLAAPCLVSLRD